MLMTYVDLVAYKSSFDQKAVVDLSIKIIAPRWSRLPIKLKDSACLVTESGTKLTQATQENNPIDIKHFRYVLHVPRV